MIYDDEPMKNLTTTRNERRRVLGRWRSVSATLFAAAMAMCFVPTGCAVSDEHVEAPPQPSEHAQPLERSLDPSVVIAFGACVKEGVSRLSRHAYDISFEVEVTPKGVMRSVESKGRRLGDEAIETCMIQALKAMSVGDLLKPDDSLLDELAPASSQQISPSGRGLLANTAVLPQLIRLAPIVIAAPGGITIVVAVVVVVAVVAVAATMSKECQQEWRKAKDKCAELLDSNDPPHDVTGGYVNTKDCARGLVRQSCGGNRYDGDGQPARPGRRT